jgi:hypothetical protein
MMALLSEIKLVSTYMGSILRESAVRAHNKITVNILEVPIEYAK